MKAYIVVLLLATGIYTESFELILQTHVACLLDSNKRRQNPVKIACFWVL
jgi:hypothetical protein